MLFKDVVGQDSIKQVLIDSVKNDRISHAQLFYENEGNGAFQLAMAYARYVLCANKQEQDACGECGSCVKISQLAHPDLHFSFPIQLSAKGKTSDTALTEWKELVKTTPYFTENDWYKKLGNENKKGVIGKDESEQILKKLQLKSFEGNYKIVIMFGAHAMNTSAANKLLKLIEEPANRTLFLLTTTSLETILPTILSRTQIAKLKKPKPESIVEFLQKNGAPLDKANAIGFYVNGNVAEAVQLYKGEDPSEEYFNLFMAWMRICFSRDVGKSIEFSADIASLGREKQKGFLSFCLTVFQKSLAGNFLSIDNVKINPAQKGFMEKFMPFITPANAMRLHETLTDAHYHVDRNANAKILFLDVSFKLFSLIKR